MKPVPAAPAAAGPDAGLEAEGVTAPAGFRAGVASADVRQDGSDRPDVAVLISELPAAGAGLFTRNRVRAAPVVISALHLRRGTVRAVVVNSGNANACTGARGLGDALRMTQVTADAVACDAGEVLVASTGVIGRPLPMERLVPAIRAAAAAASPAGGPPAARAIMTTDTVPKTAVARVTVGGHRYTVGGMAKGSGMIHPDMATLLVFCTTDAPLPAAVLQPLLGQAVDGSFHCITVDGDTSTNDTVLALANGQAGGPPLAAGSAGAAAVGEALAAVCLELARAVVRDGEGATRAFTVRVEGAADVAAARRAARTIAGSPLVKTAIHGADPNWGRILAALGRSDVDLTLDRCTVTVGGAAVFRRGVPVEADLDQIAKAFRQPEVAIGVDLGAGEAVGSAYGCDLSCEYVRINGDYTT